MPSNSVDDVNLRWMKPQNLPHKMYHECGFFQIRPIQHEYASQLMQVNINTLFDHKTLMIKLDV
jgi:hypothetical protein